MSSIEAMDESLEEIITRNESMNAIEKILSSPASSTHLEELSNINVPSPRSSVSYQSSSEDVDKDETQPAKTVGKTGTLKDNVYPKHRNRLFWKILYGKDIGQIMSYWMNEYRLNKERGIIDLYQLFVDVSTYQHIDMEKYLMEQERDINEIVKYLENSSNSYLNNSGRYFLFIRNKQHMSKIARINEFIANFIALCSKEKMLYEFDLFSKLVTVLILMSGSIKRSIKHTGVYFAIKFQTGLVRLTARIFHKSTNLKNRMETESDVKTIEEMHIKFGKLKNYDNELCKIISILQLNVLDPNINFRDPRLHFMREDCLSELYTWIEIFPERHLYRKNLDYFVTAMTDGNRTLRYKAIECISNMASKYKQTIHSKLPKLIGPIAKHISDVDIRVAILAIDTLNIIRRIVVIPNDIREMLIKHLYVDQYPVAAACGKYVAEFIFDKNGDKGDDHLLRLFLMFVQKSYDRGFKGMHAAIIEAMYDHFPLFQNVEVFIKLLEENEISEGFSDHFLQILTECVRQTFLGRSSIHRTNPRNGPIVPKVVQKMKDDLVKHLKTLFDYYDAEKLLPLLLLIRNQPNIVEESENTVEEPESIAEEPENIAEEQEHIVEPCESSF